MNGQFLRVTDGMAAGAEIQLDDDLLIGRVASGDGSLGGDPELSREHAKVKRAGAGLVIEDLGSTNGTYVNGVRVTEITSLGPGDTIWVGATTIEVAGSAPSDLTAQRPIPEPVQSTRTTPIPGAEAPPPAVEGPPPGFEGPPPGFEPPPGFTGPPPGFEPPPGFTGPPPGFEFPPGFEPPPGFTGPPGGIPAAMKARIRRLAMLMALAGIILGFGLGTLIWKVL